ncbi:MAG: hypothetical protein O2815_07115, partial [Actinomycetota bacterium]|nr:hypothetical protein [Actinomycetota bacterium]
MNRETDQTLIKSVTHGKIANAESHVSADRVMMNGHVVHLNTDPLLPERAENLSTLVDRDRKEVVPVTPAIGRARGKFDAEAGQLTAVGERDLVSALVELVDPPEL